MQELVTAIIAYDVPAPAPIDAGEPIKLRTYGDLDLDRLAFEILTSHAVLLALPCLALREGVKRIGCEVYRLGGGTGTMLDSMVKVAEMDRAHAGRRGSILNAAWEGIGAADDRWRA